MKVKKYDGSWKLCIDFTDLNKACTKDSYRLPDIDTKINSLAFFKYMCFPDTYIGYHQVLMATADEEKTSFHTYIGIHCYTKMTFGLKNADSSYQKLIDKVFSDQIGKNLEVYVNDVVFKSKTVKVMLSDIAETMINLRKNHIKLNPCKCSFRVEEGKF